MYQNKLFTILFFFSEYLYMYDQEFIKIVF